jgi:hypothetical protein
LELSQYFSKNLNMFKFFSKFAKFGFSMGLTKGKLGGACWWITSTFYMRINKRNGSSTRIYIVLGFKLINSMSFGESLFSAGLS